jgi:DNA-binding IclR family transcriptional regulator
MPTGKSDYFAKTLGKGIRVLNLFNEEKPAWNLTEIAETLDLNLTSAYRLVNTFIELGYLKRGGKSKMISLGPMAVALAHQLLHGFDPNRLIEPLVDDYHSRYGVSIDVALLHGDDLVQVCSRETSGTLTYRQETINRQLYCTGTGKAILATLPDQERERLLQRQSFTPLTEHTITTVKALYRELEETGKRGYARNNEEYIKGLIALAAPIKNISDGHPLGAVAFTSTTLESSLDDFESRFSAVILSLAEKLAEVAPNL